MRTTWKQIEARRETRLWIERIVVPTVLVTGCTILAFREEIKQKAHSAKEKIKGIFKKK